MHNVSSHEALAQNIPSGIEAFKLILAPAAKAAGYLYLDRVGAEVYLCLCTLSIPSAGAWGPRVRGSAHSPRIFGPRQRMG